MNYKEFTTNLLKQQFGTDIVNSFMYKTYQVNISESFTPYINGIQIDQQLQSLEEAIQYSKNIIEEQILKQTVYEAAFKTLNPYEIADIIKESHNIKVTDKLIEKYIQIASSRTFSLDPVVQKIRSMTKHGNLIEDRVDFRLNDGSTVVISKETQEKLNILEDQREIIDYMKESKENFLHVVELISESEKKAIPHNGKLKCSGRKCGKIFIDQKSFDAHEHPRPVKKEKYLTADDACESCRKKVAEHETPHGILCPKCYKDLGYPHNHGLSYYKEK